MSTDIRHIFGDYRPGHTHPVDLRIAIGHNAGTPFTRPHSLLRIHGTYPQTLAALAVLVNDGITDLDHVGTELCSPHFVCTHSYWHGPADLTHDQVLTALAVLAGTDRLPYAEPIGD